MAPSEGATLWGKLPAEIQMLISEYTLRFERPIKKLPIKSATSTTPDGEPAMLPVRSRVALSFVNKRTLSEVLPILYQVRDHLTIYSSSRGGR